MKPSEQKNQKICKLFIDKPDWSYLDQVLDLFKQEKDLQEELTQKFIDQPNWYYLEEFLKAFKDDQDMAQIKNALNEKLSQENTLPEQEKELYVQLQAMLE